MRNFWLSLLLCFLCGILSSSPLLAQSTPDQPPAAIPDISEIANIDTNDDGMDEPDSSPSEEDGQVDAQCEQFSKPVSWNVCIYKTAGSKNKDVLYFFHGK